METDPDPEHNLPNDLIDFLQTGLSLEYDPVDVHPGEVKLKSLEDLELDAVWVDSDGSPLRESDPNKEEEGYYELPAISLISSCEHYEPDFVLLWLPTERLFGAWDCDHWDLYVFPETTWTQITETPRPFLNAVWEDYDREFSDYFIPFPKYPFQRGHP